MRYKNVKCKKIKKKCTCCNSIKSILKFNKRRDSGDGYRNECKSCKRIKSLKYNNICEVCGQQFKTDRVGSKFCSKECLGNHMRRVNSGKYKGLDIENIKFNCNYCNKESVQRKSYYDKHSFHFCSKQCMVDYNSKKLYSKVKCECDYCKKDIEIHKSKFRKYDNHFCSEECYYNSMSGEDGSRWRRVFVTCSNCNKSIEKPIWNSNRNTHNFCNNDCKAEWQKINLTRENNPFWNPELTDDERMSNKQRHLNPEYRLWMSEVYKRDNWTCQCCNTKSNIKINAHHINGYNWDKENRTNIDNGVTLCEDCHKEFHKIYGNGNNTKDQFEDWIHNKRNLAC